MKNNLWKTLMTAQMTALVIAGLITSVSCTKKTIITQQPETIEGTSGTGMSQSQAKQEEQERIKSQNLQDELAKENKLRQIQRTTRENFINQHILFDFDSYALNDRAKILIKEKMGWLDANQGIAITIEGHCDEKGTTDYNLALGERRAVAVKTYLTSLGISPSRMTGVSYGEEKPINNGQDEQAHRENRRAQVFIQ